MIYVTHDQIEALTLADRIAVMRDGVIQQLSTPKEIYQKPVNRFVAEFLGQPGMNFLEGVFTQIEGAPALRLNDATAILLTGYEFSTPPQEGRPISLGIRPEHLKLEASSANSSTLDFKISRLEMMGSDGLVWGHVADHPVAISTDPDPPYGVGNSLVAAFKPSEASLFDAATGSRL